MTFIPKRNKDNKKQLKTYNMNEIREKLLDFFFFANKNK